MNQFAFLPLARKFFNSDLWMQPREFSNAEAWLDMLANACYQPETRLCSGHAISLQRGELVGSLRFLAARWAWSKGRTERFLDALRKAGRVTFRDANGTANRVISLCNYGLYNKARDKLGTATETSPGQQRDKVEEGEEAPSGQEAMLRESSARGGASADRPDWSEVQMHAQRIGLADWKALDWFREMEGCGWLDHNQRPVQRWQSILERVRTKWEADGRPSGPPSGSARRGDGAGSGTADKILASKELDRIEQRIGAIRAGYSEHMSVSDEDRETLKGLRLRKKELKERLGFVV